MRLCDKENRVSYKKAVVVVGGKGHIAMRSGLRVCLREGHSTVPYIKLSAPRLSRSSKWSLMA